MDVLGHSQISLTMNTYTHVLPELRRSAADRMSELINDLRSVVGVHGSAHAVSRLSVSRRQRQRRVAGAKPDRRSDRRVTADTV